MKPLAAWLAMGVVYPDDPIRLPRGELMTSVDLSALKTQHNGTNQPVLIVPDTEENRRKLGMEEA